MKEENRHNYEYEVDLNGDTAPARVVRMIGQGKRVLEIGAGPGSITRHLKETGNCTVTALEIDEDAIKKLSPFCERVYSADLNDPTWPELLSDEGKFEVVLAADILEHLYDPWATLEAMKDLITDDGHIIISLPHIAHSAVVACLLDEDFTYRDWGLLDRTHIRFFGLKNMQALVEGAGLKIEEAQFVVVPPEDTEFENRWQKLPSKMRQAFSTNQYWLVYQVVIKAGPKERSGQSVDLMTLPVDVPHKRIEKKLRSVLRSFLSTATRAKLRGIARSLGIR